MRQTAHEQLLSTNCIENPSQSPIWRCRVLDLVGLGQKKLGWALGPNHLGDGGDIAMPYRKDCAFLSCDNFVFGSAALGIS